MNEGIGPPKMPGSWYTAVGVFAAWTLSACGFWTIPFVMPEIRSAFHLDQTQTASLVSITLAARFAGAVIAGCVAELYGRKVPLVVSAAVSGTMGAASAATHSYPLLLLIRAAFGMGLGGVWVAGFAFALDRLSGRERGTVSGLLQGGWNWGYLLAAIAHAGLAVSGRGSWRNLLSFGALPLLAVPWILFLTSNPPLPVRRPEGRGVRESFAPFALLFRRGTVRATIHTAAVMAAFMVLYYCVTTYYQSFITAIGHKPLAFVVALNAGAICGGFIFGRLSSTRTGKRGAVTIAAAGIPLSLPFYLASGSAALAIGSCSMGLFALGMWGVVPHYLSERFPEGMRAIGPGLAYHLGALLASPSPLLIGWLLDHGCVLRDALMLTILVASIAVVIIVWGGAESEATSSLSRRERESAVSSS
jgi:SHS family lactate transporter-like MFS transporter